MKEAEIVAVENAVLGVPPDHRLVAEAPDDPKELAGLSLEMLKSLFALNCEFYQVVHETRARQIVADGWYERPEIMARYEPPGLQKKSGMAMDLTPHDRERLRKVVRKTHRMYFRDEPTEYLLDSLIDGLGPEAARSLLKRAIDAGKL